jgi:hypothetical protein
LSLSTIGHGATIEEPLGKKGRARGERGARSGSRVYRGGGGGDTNYKEGVAGEGLTTGESGRVGAGGVAAWALGAVEGMAASSLLISLFES